MGQITIAIDGFSSCGKSTLAKDLARSLHYAHIDSGALYRALAYCFLKKGIDFWQDKALAQSLEEISLSLAPTKERTILYLNGVELDDRLLRTSEVNEIVSDVAKISRVRQELLSIQREQTKHGGIVMDGRDIGSVVFPNADLKIYLVADPDVRTMRRYEELKAKDPTFTGSIEEVRENLLRRDHIDSTRKDSPLVKAEDAIEIDNTNLTRAEQFEMIKVLAEMRARTKV